MKMTEPRAVAFVRENVQGWVGNLMRDMDAQSTPLDVDDVAKGLRQVAELLTTEFNADEFTEFLREQNEGRDGNDW